MWLKGILVCILAVVVYKGTHRISKMIIEPAVKPGVAGFFHPSFRKVAELFRNNIESDIERGAMFSVVHKGEVLLDLWGGMADTEAERPLQEESVVLSWSVTKGLAALCLARLYDMGYLDYSKEVREYWPEFGTGTKKNITLNILLSHQSGLMGFKKPLSLFQYRDQWDVIEKALIDLEPIWPPGTAKGYHSWTFGMFADVLVRRIDPQHRNISQFFQEEIAKPFDLDIHIGLPKPLYYRFAKVHLFSLLESWNCIPDLLAVLTSPIFWKTSFDFDIAGRLLLMNDPERLSIGHPSLGGVSSAKSLAVVYDILASGGKVNDKRLVSQKAFEILKKPLTEGLPRKYFAFHQYSVGLISRKSPQNFQLLGHQGYGGNWGFADLNNSLGMAYLTNHLSYYFRDDPRFTSLQTTFYECFEKYKNIHREKPVKS